MMHHQAYQPLLPAVNKYLQQKWDKASYDLHRQNVKTAKPTINTTAPKTYGHLALKLKKQKLDEEWNIKIQKENNLLLEKIAHIMRTTGAVDNMNYYEKKSLNKKQRQIELLRITHENQIMLHRLSLCKPHYNVRSWQEDWHKTLWVMDSIARYPRGEAKNLKDQEKPKNPDLDKEQKTMVNKTNNPHTTKEDSTEKEKKKETTMDKTKTETTTNLTVNPEKPNEELTDPASDTKSNSSSEQKA